MKKPYLVILAAILGLTAGLVAGHDSQNSYCDDIEQQVVERDQLQGTLACFDPEATDVQISEEVQEETELRCVCRNSYQGYVQYIPIASAGN